MGTTEKWASIESIGTTARAETLCITELEQLSFIKNRAEYERAFSGDIRGTELFSQKKSRRKRGEKI